MTISTYDASSFTVSSVGTEQTIKSINVPGDFSLVLDLNTLAFGDWLIINVYKIAKTGGTSRLIKQYAFSGVQNTTLVWESDRYRNDLTDTDALVFKVNQYLGTARATPWTVLRDADTDVYQAKAWMSDDNAAGTPADRYSIRWFKNSLAITSGITVPVITVKDEAGTALINAQTMTQVVSTGRYIYDAVTSERTANGVSYEITMTATIDGATRTWMQPISRDS